MPRAKIPEVDVIDFETKPILAAPDYPPVPVGVSIWPHGERRGRYYAWGHPSENNCTRDEARRALAGVWKGRRGILCHHAKFDLNVALEHMGLALLPWERVHDTMFLIFYRDPYTHNLGLKEAALDILGIAPEERDAIRDWAIENKLMPKSRKEAGEFIHLAPGKLVGAYANGDTMRTRRLFQHCYPEVMERGMGRAYDRDRRLLPALMDNEREGIRGDRAALEADAKKFGAASDAEKFGSREMFAGGAMDQADDWLRKALRCPGLNVDSDEELADALVRARKADADGFLLTPGGKRSTAKDSVIGAVKDRRVLGVLQYRSRLATAKNTFILPWLREIMSPRSGGRVRPSWNQVRLHGHGGDAGARTGRLSASRFMNVPKPFLEKAGKFEHPHWAGLPELPRVRDYLLPDEGELWGKRDYSQQELRVLAHFEDGALLRAYLENPRMDIHQMAADLARALGIDPLLATRDTMKTIGFALLYGMGLGSLAERLGIAVHEAKALKAAYLSIFPGLKELDDSLKDMGRSDVPMVTWGGREYFVEPPKYSEKYGRMQSFEYKLLNYLIQGSSADCTKEAIIRYHEARRDGKFRVTVHDEINISVPKRAAKREMLLLRDVMASVEFDVPMLSDGALGERWGRLEKIDEPAYRADRATYRVAA